MAHAAPAGGWGTPSRHTPYGTGQGGLSQVEQHPGGV